MRKPILTCCLLVLAGGAVGQEQLITLKNDTITMHLLSKGGGTPLYIACRATAADGVIASENNGYGRLIQVPAPMLRSGSGLMAGSGALPLKRAAICWHPESPGL